MSKPPKPAAEVAGPEIGFVHCIHDAFNGELRLRVWISDPADVASLGVFDEAGTELGVGVLNEARDEVGQAHGRAPGELNGADLTLPVAGPVGRTVRVVFRSARGAKIAARKTYVAETGDVFRIEDLAYDSASRQARFSGFFRAPVAVRSMAVHLADGRIEPVAETYLWRPDLPQPKAGAANFYPGFRGRVHGVSLGALRNATFVAEMVDGRTLREPLSQGEARQDQPLAEIEAAEFDWMADRFSVTGWFRSLEPVTQVQIRAGTAVCQALVEVQRSPRVMEAQRFAGAQAYEVSVQGSISQGFEDLPGLLSGETPVVTLALFNRGEPSFEIAAPADRVQVRRAEITFAMFDHRNAMLCLMGRSTAARPPVSGQVFRGGQAVGSALPLSLVGDDADEGAALRTTEWTWLHPVNAVFSPHTPTRIRLFDAAGEAIEVDRGETPVLVVSGDGVMEGGSSGAVLADALHRHNFRPQHLPRDTVFVTVQAATPQVMGGLAKRTLEMVRMLKLSGYRVALLDRTAPWDIALRPEAYRDLRSLCDYHLMAPLGAKRTLAERAVAALESGSRDRHDDATLGLLDKALRTGKLTPLNSRLLKERTDSVFNALATAIINHHRPRLAITNFAWSAETHMALRPEVFGMLDTHDIQHLRYRVFQRARETFGPMCVPDIDRYAADEGEEMGLLQRPQALIAISAEEHALLAATAGAHRVVHAGVSVAAPRRLGSPEASRTVLFVGGLYEPNSYGLRRFVETAWWTIREAVPEAVLKVAGPVCEGIEDLAGNGVELLGVVDALEPLYAEAAVVINPVLFGSGLSVKNIEALGYGKALVSTDVAARGMEGAVDAWAMASVAPDFQAERVIALLTDLEARRALEQAAADYAEGALSPARVMADFNNFVESKLYYGG